MAIFSKFWSIMFLSHAPYFWGYQSQKHRALLGEGMEQKFYEKRLMHSNVIVQHPPNTQLDRSTDRQTDKWQTVRLKLRTQFAYSISNTQTEKEGEKGRRRRRLKTRIRVRERRNQVNLLHCIVMLSYSFRSLAISIRILLFTWYMIINFHFQYLESSWKLGYINFVVLTRNQNWSSRLIAKIHIHCSTEASMYHTWEK